jgi:hypothetical protein
MPYSYKTWDNLIRAWTWQHVPPLAPILDVGAGAGKLAKLLRTTHPNIDALECFAPYIKRFKLADLYRRVVLGDIRQMDVTPYRLVLMGDVLEHLSLCEAQSVLSRITCPVLVQVPYRLPQGVCEGNEAEIHAQPDLTPGIMRERYPHLQTLDSAGHGGLYLQPGSAA